MEYSRLSTVALLFRQLLPCSGPIPAGRKSSWRGYLRATTLTNG